MSIRIKNYQAGSVWEVNSGTRQMYDSTNAMLTDSLLTDFLLDKITIKNGTTRDIICMNFDYGTRSYEQEIAHLNKTPSRAKYLDMAKANKDRFTKLSADQLRMEYYTNGVDIKYPVFKHRQIDHYEAVHYKMLYRTPGKAKKGSCMFIVDSLYETTHHFLTMGLTLPDHNAPIVEIGAYSSLVSSTIIDHIQIKPEEILILKDVYSSFKGNAISVELDAHKHCIAVPRSDYEMGNTLFDGQALIDSSIFPTFADGYILLRHHFTKMAAFCSHIQQFYKDKFGADYETATVTDMWGNKHLAKNIKLITTDNAIKWLKFNVSFEYWSDWVRANNCMFGIVKTAHPSKLGNVQRMSYQMVNSLAEDTMDSVLAKSKDYIIQLKTNLDVFKDYLRKNTNFSNDYDVLLALLDNIPDWERSEYFRYRRKVIIRSYLLNLKSGRVIQNADNLTIVGSPYAMLMHSIGEDPLTDPTFAQEDDGEAIQCWCGKFVDGEYLAEFRSPFNSCNNLGHLHNVCHPLLLKYFDLGNLCIAVNMVGTDFQNRNNGADQDLTN